MNREQIIKIAKESGIVPALLLPQFDNFVFVERFAAAIRAATKEEDAEISQWCREGEEAAQAIRASK